MYGLRGRVCVCLYLFACVRERKYVINLPNLIMRTAPDVLRCQCLITNSV